LSPIFVLDVYFVAELKCKLQTSFNLRCRVDKLGSHGCELHTLDRATHTNTHDRHIWSVATDELRKPPARG